MTEVVAVPVAVGALVTVLVAAGLAPFVLLDPRADPSAARRTLHRALVAGYVAAVAAATLVPLPEPGTSASCLPPDARVQLVPLHALTGAAGGGLWPASLGQVALNVLLLVPLGVVLHRWWGMSWRRAALVGAVVSLGIETTQLTAVWGVYDCPHRVFDVDDLLANVAGTALGALLSDLSAAPRPTRRE